MPPIRTLSVGQFRKGGHVLAARGAGDLRHSLEVHRYLIAKNLAKVTPNHFRRIGHQCAVRDEADRKTTHGVLDDLELFHLGAVPDRGCEMPWRNQLAVAQSKQID